MSAPDQPSILTEAEAIINGPRRASYGDVAASFQRVATIWNALLIDKLKQPLTATDIPLCMIGLKLCREANKEARDNRVDICGYAALLEQLQTPTQPTSPTP
jgi:hypothetical protein